MKFWMVWNPINRPPTFKHLTLEDAKKEAGRLARMSPESVFHVLELVGSCKRNDVLWITPDQDPDRDIPF
jgi:hypothetical protein